MALFWVARRWQQQHSEELSDHSVHAHADTCRERLTAIMNKALRRKDGTATPHLGQPHPGWFVLGLPLSQHAVGLSNNVLEHKSLYRTCAGPLAGLECHDRSQATRRDHIQFVEETRRVSSVVCRAGQPSPRLGLETGSRGQLPP